MIHQPIIILKLSYNYLALYTTLFTFGSKTYKHGRTHTTTQAEHMHKIQINVDNYEQCLCLFLAVGQTPRPIGTKLGIRICLDPGIVSCK